MSTKGHSPELRAALKKQTVRAATPLSYKDKRTYYKSSWRRADFAHDMLDVAASHQFRMRNVNKFRPLTKAQKNTILGEVEAFRHQFRMSKDRKRFVRSLPPTLLTTMALYHGVERKPKETHDELADRLTARMNKDVRNKRLRIAAVALVPAALFLAYRMRKKGSKLSPSDLHLSGATPTSSRAITPRNFSPASERSEFESVYTPMPAGEYGQLPTLTRTAENTYLARPSNSKNKKVKAE